MLEVDHAYELGADASALEAGVEALDWSLVPEGAEELLVPELPLVPEPSLGLDPPLGLEPVLGLEGGVLLEPSVGVVPEPGAVGVVPEPGSVPLLPLGCEGRTVGSVCVCVRPGCVVVGCGPDVCDWPVLVAPPGVCLASGLIAAFPWGAVALACLFAATAWTRRLALACVATGAELAGTWCVRDPIRAGANGDASRI